jgi:hypothetical protein
VCGAGEPLEHGRRELGRAQEDGPHCHRERLSRCLCLAEGAHRLLALVARGAVEDQDPVEVIDLVLNHAGFEP